MAQPRGNGWTGGQYSLFRVLLAASTVPWLWQVDRARMAAAPGELGPWFPNLLEIWTPELHQLLGPAGAVVSFSSLGTVLAVFVALGRADRFAALVLAYASLCVRDLMPPIPGVAGWPVGETLLLVHALVPGVPYGALTARGRTDPGGLWRLPEQLHAAAWLAVGLAHMAVASRQLTDRAWLDVGGLTAALTGPATIIQLLALPVATSRRLRPFAWLGLITVQLVALFTSAEPAAALMALSAHVLLFDPAWIAARAAPAPAEAAPPAEPDTVFYDGSCGLCHGAVRFLLAEDTDARFVFTHLGSETFERLVPVETRATLPDSIVVRDPCGHLHMRSAAVLYLLARLGGLWRVAATLGALVPRPLADLTYDGVARTRYKLFGKKTDACPMIPSHLRSRFAP